MQQPLVQRGMIEIGEREPTRHDERVSLVVVEARPQRDAELGRRKDSDEAKISRAGACAAGGAQSRRSTIMVLMCAIALAGLRPLGQVFAQLRIV